MIESYSVDDKLIIHAFRRDELKVFNLTLKPAELTTCFLQVNKQANDEQCKSKEKWLFI